MKKLIYYFLILLNALFINAVSAQKQYCYSNYSIDSIAYNPVQPYYVGTPLTVKTDTFSAVIPIGFSFNFYGTDFTSLVISPNAYLTFNTDSAGKRVFINPLLQIPSNSYTANSIFLFAQEFYPWPSGTINYSTTGTSPNQKFIASFDSVYLHDSNLNSTYYCTGQIVLYETSNIIEMYIANAVAKTGGGGGSMIEGVQNSTATLAAAPPRHGGYPPSIQNDGRRFTQVNLPNPYTNPICMVGVDSATNKNMVIWDKGEVGATGPVNAANVAIDSFIIYRETNAAGVYAQIGSQPYSAFSTFIDTGSNPAQQANRYKLSFLDSCGEVSAQSAEHKTVHLTINQGVGNTWNLIWDAYEGFTFSSFILYRGTTASNMDSLTTIASNLYSYTDLSPPVGTVYYMIEVVNPDPCTPLRITGGNGSFNSSLSNIVNNHVVGIQSYLDEYSIDVFPNPASNQLTIHSSSFHNEPVMVSVMNVMGQETSPPAPLQRRGEDAMIDISGLPSGMYFLQMKGESGSVVKKFMKSTNTN